MSDKILWQDWDEEDWGNAVFCPDCGLPMIRLDDDGEHGAGAMQCVYCTWESDQTSVFNQRLHKMIVVLQNILRYLRARGGISTTSDRVFVMEMINHVLEEVKLIGE